MSKSLAVQPAPTAKPAVPTAYNETELKRLLALSPKDSAATKQLMAILDETGMADVYVKGFDVAWQAESSLSASFAQGDLLLRELTERRMKEMRREVAGPNPSPLETLLVERVALCWLHVHSIESTVTQRAAGVTVNVAEYEQKRLDKAHKRYLSAIKTLAQVRKLQLPTVQVNIGEKQVNIANVDQISG